MGKNKKVKYDSDGLIDGWKCPICKKDFRYKDWGYYDCPHGWRDVNKWHNKMGTPKPW